MGRSTPQVFTRGNPWGYDNWTNQHGCDGRAFSDIQPYFIRSEDFEMSTEGTMEMVEVMSQPPTAQHIKRPAADIRSRAAPSATPRSTDVRRTTVWARA